MRIFSIVALVIVAGFGGYTALLPSPQEDPPDALKTFMEEFVEIRPGSAEFPKPVTPVFPFAISKYETTQGLYSAVMGTNPSRWKGFRNSVESMTYSEAVAFCERVTGMLRLRSLLTDAEEIRLPTEAEWEYACRAGTTTAYSFGEDATAPEDQEPMARLLNDYAWHHGNAAGNDPEVGVLKPNPWGLYDMHGYLWEYVSDPWRARMSDPPADELPGSTQRTMRSGSWRDHYSQLKSSTRWGVADHVRSDAIGFRCVKAPVPR